MTTTVPTPFRKDEGGKSDLEKQREIERFLQSKFNKKADRPRVSGDSRAAPRGTRGGLDSLILSDEERARLPETKDKYLVRENPNLVQWERETRKKEVFGGFPIWLALGLLALVLVGLLAITL